MVWLRREENGITHSIPFTLIIIILEWRVSEKFPLPGSSITSNERATGGVSWRQNAREDLVSHSIHLGTGWTRTHSIPPTSIWLCHWKIMKKHGNSWASLISVNVS